VRAKYFLKISAPLKKFLRAPLTMTTVRHYSLLEFCRGAYNQAIAPGITSTLHATDTPLYSQAKEDAPL